MKKQIIILTVIALLLLTGCTTGKQNTQAAQDNQPAQEQQTNPAAIQQTQETTSEKIIKVKMSQYKFDPDPLVLKQGEEVTLELTSLDVPHGFSAPGIGVETARVDPGQVLKVKAKPETKGTFTVRCSVFCGGGHKEMKGTIIVE